jgi:hypothetical protein
MRSGRLAQGQSSNCRGQSAERGGESKVSGLVGGDLVVAAAQVLHERVFSLACLTSRASAATSSSLDQETILAKAALS